MIKQITILGAGSAGLFTAIALRRKLPDVKVQVIRSPEIGVIGVERGPHRSFRRCSSIISG